MGIYRCCICIYDLLCWSYALENFEVVHVALPYEYAPAPYSKLHIASPHGPDSDRVDFRDFPDMVNTWQGSLLAFIPAILFSLVSMYRSSTLVACMLNKKNV
jgi:hypothetical protein